MWLMEFAEYVENIRVCRASLIAKSVLREPTFTTSRDTKRILSMFVNTTGQAARSAMTNARHKASALDAESVRLIMARLSA
jgi:hypothetical protein